MIKSVRVSQRSRMVRETTAYLKESSPLRLIAGGVEKEPGAEFQRLAR
jgi:hypothetical protein